MSKRILAILGVLLLVAMSFNVVSADTGYVEKVGRDGDNILYRLVKTERNVSDKETTLGFVWAKGAYNLNHKVEWYVKNHNYNFTNWSYKEYTRMRYIRYDTIIVSNE